MTSPNHSDQRAEPDYTLVDQPGLTSAMFYPRPSDYPPSGGDAEYFVEVAPQVRVAARFFAGDASWPSILFFHGNGEVASDYDEVAPLYRERRVNLVVAEFRGYGGSTGIPTVAALMSDAHPIAGAFHAQLDQQGSAPRRYIMGRSLGAHPALELAANSPEGFDGLIIESGAGMIRRMLDRRGLLDTEEGRRLADAHDAKLRSIRLPVLFIHGADDELVPASTAGELHDHLAEAPRTFVLIPDVGHNNLMWGARRQYFDAIEGFVYGAGGSAAFER